MANELHIEARQYDLGGIAPHMREGVAVTNRDGEQIYNVSCIIPPTEDGGKLETLEVRVPASGVAKQMLPYTPIKFERLVARFWSIDGRSGISYSADSVKPVSPPKAAS